MSRMYPRGRAVFIPALIIALLLLGIASAFAKDRKMYYDPRTFARAEVMKIERSNIGTETTPQSEIRVHLQILDGTRKGERHVSIYRGDDDIPKEMFYREGDTVFIGISTIDGADAVEYISIYDVDNTAGIIILGVLLAAVIILIGRARGALSMLALVATIILIFKVLIPSTLAGSAPLPIAVGISLLAIVITIPIILGLKKKTAAAILGASSGVILATALSLFAGWLMHLSGIVTDEMMTVFYASTVEIDLRGLAMAGMVIAALGAIMDVCISIASAAEEIFRVNPGISVREAFKSVMTVSSDMLGATVNTLLFAYVGSALPLVLLIAMKIEPGMPIWLVFNHNPVLSELVKSAVGCIGMFLGMPATAFICIELHKRKRPSGA
ncbi:MAG: YibE/F family protein [Spirochaetes bacterium]|nr:YibE/F family protein [Spirochaetota bacterium]